MTTPIFEAYEKSLRSRPEAISPYTVRGYLRDLRKFAGWFERTNGEPMRLRDATPIDVQDYKAHLQMVRKHKPTTINRRLAALCSYFARVVDEGLLAAYSGPCWTPIPTQAGH